MIKWLFAVIIALLAFVMNAAVLDSQHGWIVLLYGLTVANIFALSLVFIWLAAYLSRFRNRRFGIIGHAFVYLAGGVGFAGLGHFGLSNDACVSPSEAVNAWMSEQDACSALSLLSIAFGVFVMWPSLKLLRALATR